MTYEPSAEQHINSASAEACAMATREGRAVTFKFNDVVLVAEPNEAPEALALRFHAECERRITEWKNSAKGKAAEAEAERELEQDVCWCGVEKPYYAPLPATCGGSGMQYCHCGGDLCVCHWHGEVECFGCADCRDEDETGGADE